MVKAGAVITLRAHAKVNLALAVGPPEPAGSAHPGWHPIASWMHAISLWDELTIEPLPHGSAFAVSWAEDAPRPGPIDWTPEQDLAARAHRLLEREAGRELPARMRLVKRIPVGSGLGGGSSDGAAALRGLNMLFGLGLSTTRLAELSRSLGSDVAFFVDGEPARPALVEGFGDRIERLGRTRADLLLIIPPVACATASVYRAYDGLNPGALRADRARALAAGGTPEGGLFNDLDRAAEAVAPELAGLRRRASEAAGAPVHMSGSGSCLFTLDAPGRRAALERALGEASVVVASLV